MTDSPDEIPLKPYYVYVLIDPRLRGDEAVFYVGKGKDSRALAHGKHAARFEGEETDSPRLHRIKAIRADGLEPLARVVARFDSAAEALAVEAVLIRWMYGLGRRLTNRVEGHHADEIRPRNDFQEMEGLDVPARKSERDGTFTRNVVLMTVAYGTEGRLVKWREHLAQNGYDFSEPDMSTNKLGPCIVRQFSGPFSLHLVSRVSGANQVILRFYPSSAETRTAFIATANEPSIARYIKDGCVKRPESSKPYFTLNDHHVAQDYDVAAVINAIRSFEALLA